MKKFLLGCLMAMSSAAFAAVPTLKITAPVLFLQPGQSTTVTFTFSEPVTGFTIDDANISANGTFTSALTGSGAVYSVTFQKTVEKTSTSIVVDNKSYTAISDGSLGTYAQIGFNAAPIYYMARGGIFASLKDVASPQPFCMLAGEELVNSADNTPATVLKETFYVVNRNSFERVKQGCLLRPQTGQVVRKKVAPRPAELATPQGAHNHTTLMPKASYQDIGRVEGWSRPRIAKANHGCVPNATTGVYRCGELRIGSFRLDISPTRIASDDPIVYPGQKGAAHLHAFFANTTVNFATNNATLRSACKTVTAGGIVNCSAYWMPVVIDTASNTALMPEKSVFYYKADQDNAPGNTEPIPQGLKAIIGKPQANSDATATDVAQWSCALKNGVTATTANPSVKYAPTGMVGSIPECSGKYYNIIAAEVAFPECVQDDGFGNIKLDSPDHRSHFAPSTGFVASLPNGCNAAFPHRITKLTQNIDYQIPSGANTKTWRLSSDNYSASIPGGFSLHADYWAMWQNYWMQRMTTQCNNMVIDCGTNYIGLNDGIAIASIDVVGTTATVTTVNPHYLDKGSQSFSVLNNNLKVRISGVSGTDANLYNFDPSKVISQDNTTLKYYPIGTQVISITGANTFTYTLTSTPTDLNKTGAELTGALVQWGEVMCGTGAVDYPLGGCPAEYFEYYHGNRS